MEQNIFQKTHLVSETGVEYLRFAEGNDSFDYFHELLEYLDIKRR